MQLSQSLIYLRHQQGRSTLTANSVASFSFVASTSKVFRSSTNVKGVSSKAGGFTGSLSRTFLLISCSTGSFSCKHRTCMQINCFVHLIYKCRTWTTAYTSLMLMLKLWCHGEEIFCMHGFWILSSRQEWIEWSPHPTHIHAPKHALFWNPLYFHKNKAQSIRHNVALILNYMDDTHFHMIHHQTHVKPIDPMYTLPNRKVLLYIFNLSLN